MGCYLWVTAGFLQENWRGSEVTGVIDLDIRHWLCCPNRIFFHQSSPMYHVPIIRYCILVMVHPEEIRNPDQTFPPAEYPSHTD